MQAAKSQWADQKKQIAEDTKVTIASSRAAIKDGLRNGKQRLDSLKKGLDLAEITHNERISVFDVQITELETEIETLERKKKILLQSNSALRDDNVGLNSELKIGREELIALTEQKEGITGIVSDLNSTKDELHESINEATLDYAHTSKKLEDLQQKFDSEIAELKKQVSMLEAKKSDLAQEIIDNRADDNKVRDNLANWQRKLKEQDKNLRIREAKAAEQERAIVRNYNLLNL